MIRYKRFFKERRNFNWPPFAEMEGSLRRPLPASARRPRSQFFAHFFARKSPRSILGENFQKWNNGCFYFHNFAKGINGLLGHKFGS